MDALSLLPAAVAGYLIGSVSMGVVLARVFGWPDPRLHGSGHTGALNVSRHAGRGALLIVAIADLLKGALAVWVGALIGDQVIADHPFSITAAGVSAVTGHIWPVWYRFAGGMGLATGFGALVPFSPITGVGAALTLLVVRLFVIKHTPRAVIFALLIVPPLLLLLHEPAPVLWLGIGASILLVIRHALDWNRVYASTRIE